MAAEMCVGCFGLHLDCPSQFVPPYAPDLIPAPAECALCECLECLGREEYQRRADEVLKQAEPLQKLVEDLRRSEKRITSELGEIKAKLAKYSN